MEMKRIEIEKSKRPAKLRVGVFLLGVLSMSFLACNKKSGDEGGNPETKSGTPSEAVKRESPQAEAKPETLSDTAKSAEPQESAKPAAPQEAGKPAPPKDAAKLVAKPGRFDFSLPLTPITQPLSGLSAFSGRKMLVFYFGPTCPHCQSALPEVQAFADEIRGKGYETVAIANQRSTQAEIQEFITKYHCRLPMFWDDQRTFGGAHRITMLPTIFLVKQGGEFYQLDGFNGKPALEQLRQIL